LEPEKYVLQSKEQLFAAKIGRVAWLILNLLLFITPLSLCVTEALSRKIKLQKEINQDA